MDINAALARELDPTQIERQHRYDNARHSVIKSYELAARNFNYVEDKKVLKLNDKGEKVRDYDNEIPATPQEVLAHVVSMARLMALEMTKDLNATIPVQEEPKVVTGERTTARSS